MHRFRHYGVILLIFAAISLNACAGTRETAVQAHAGVESAPEAIEIEDAGPGGA